MLEAFANHVENENDSMAVVKALLTKVFMGDDFIRKSKFTDFVWQIVQEVEKYAENYRNITIPLLPDLEVYRLDIEKIKEAEPDVRTEN